MAHVPTPEERRELGRARRKQLARQDHAQWKPEARRKKPIVLMEESMRGRVPALVSLKWERMVESPFGYFRGAVPVMAADLATLANTGIVNQICGDAHVRNLGAFAGPDGRLVFDINDFDETIRAPFEWDLKRLSTSLVLVGRGLGMKGGACDDAVQTMIARYRKFVDMFARMPVTEVARYQVHRLQRITPVGKALLKAERATPLHTVEQLTVEEKDRRRFREEKPLLTPVSAAVRRAVLASLVEYTETLQPERRHFFAQYHALDVAFKVVGTGSVGLRDYVIYMEGNGPGDPLFLQIKEQPGSAYAGYVDSEGIAPRAPQHEGRRVVNGQRAMQFQSDPFLGWTTIDSRHYQVRQLNDHKASIEIEDLAGDGLGEYAEMCGELLARGHARSGDACVLAGYVGNGKRMSEALAAFAHAYADQTVEDWEELKKARQ
ncbi:DUF2252 domain-containing protein [Silvibacterium dinghuense]|uniref:DUF2252 domain-containing protein n=1 Tax=Silvibacterium dinghuense TaxID=1560006 RepID=A0A4Q1SJS8_9BACT|nr:DUF2252 domain-containing protein [Silvibacterium dinghuense]RXS97697.1 DUF2252 domain-containing protein [Silvibacterium dinghuense]GGH01249.1 hypothetical protein GCM10011586_16090 [Silvibacterium dinghuense]